MSTTVKASLQRDAFSWLALVLLSTSLLALRTLLAAALEGASPTWTNRGLERGAVLALAVRDGSVYAVTTEGAFRLGGSGAWEVLYETRAGSVVRSGAIHTDGRATIVLSDDDGLHVSDDRGMTWRTISTHSLGGLVLGVGLGHGGAIFGGQEGAVLRSRDTGLTWKRSTAGVPREAFKAFSADPASERVLAGGDAGMYASPDGGATWQKVSGWPADVQVRSIVRHLRYPQLVYAGGVGLGVGGFFASRDGGMTWERLGQGSLRTDHVNIVLIGEQALYVGTRGVADTDTIGGVWVSRDEGRTWEQIKTKLSNSDVGALVLDTGPPRRLYAGTEGGVVFSYTIDAWWLPLVPLVPLLALLEPLLLGVVLATLVLLFASLRRRPTSAGST